MIVLRRQAGAREVLVFRHPLAGVQLVKGRVERGEDDETAARRELFEESGLAPKAPFVPLGASVVRREQSWSFFAVDLPSAPEVWLHYAQDGGGHWFDFFWTPFQPPWRGDMRKRYHRALSFAHARLKTGS